MAKAILRLTNKAATVKVYDAVATIGLATDLLGGNELISSKVPTAIIEAGNVATVTMVDHGFPNGALVAAVGITPAGYNVTATITVIDKDTFTYPVGGPLVDATVFGTIGVKPKVSVYRVFCTGPFTVVRNSVEILGSTSTDELDLDLAQFEGVDNIESDSDLVVTVAPGVQLYMTLRKETGYISKFQPEIFGAYDNPALETA